MEIGGSSEHSFSLLQLEGFFPEMPLGLLEPGPLLCTMSLKIAWWPKGSGGVYVHYSCQNTQPFSQHFLQSLPDDKRKIYTVPQQKALWLWALFDLPQQSLLTYGITFDISHFTHHWGKRGIIWWFDPNEQDASTQKREGDDTWPYFTAPGTTLPIAMASCIP